MFPIDGYELLECCTYHPYGGNIVNYFIQRNVCPLKFRIDIKNIPSERRYLYNPSFFVSILNLRGDYYIMFTFMARNFYSIFGFEPWEVLRSTWRIFLMKKISRGSYRDLHSWRGLGFVTLVKGWWFKCWYCWWKKSSKPLPPRKFNTSPLERYRKKDPNRKGSLKSSSSPTIF